MRSVMWLAVVTLIAGGLGGAGWAYGRQAARIAELERQVSDMDARTEATDVERRAEQARLAEVEAAERRQRILRQSVPLEHAPLIRPEPPPIVVRERYPPPQLDYSPPPPLRLTDHSSLYGDRDGQRMEELERDVERLEQQQRGERCADGTYPPCWPPEPSG